ncbi:amidophosphoribosyltransferase [bacterium]|nr:amidophosphoribosyltransferase [bacterium]
MGELTEKCAVFAVYAPKSDVARLTYYGLSALQHRGQESSGIVVTDGEQFRSHVGPGLVAQVYSDATLDQLKGFAAVGHNRYATSGAAHDAHVQPVLRSDDLIALAHNGNIPSTKALKNYLMERKVFKRGSNDTEMMADAIRYWRYHGKTTHEAVREVWPLFTGAFSCVLLTRDSLIAFRDEHGIRPLSIGRLADGGYVVASETCAFDIIGAQFERDVLPGELIEIIDGELTSTIVRPAKEKLEIFEYIYFARPDSLLQGQRVNEVRRRLGHTLALEEPVEADVVIPVPDSSIPAALGYAEALNIEFDHGLIKNRYIHRTFISPGQQLRERAVQMKLNPLPEVVKDRRVVLVDDSIVRGTTTKQIVAMVREAGAREVHVRVSSPPVLYPDFYGINTPDQTKLIAGRLHSTQQVAAEIGADSLGYMSIEGMLGAIDRPAESLCLACFTGEYPIDLAERAAEVKRIEFERSAQSSLPIES